jgi:hypothetical protein
MIARKGAFVRSELEGIPGNCENYLKGSLRTKVPNLDARLATQSLESMVFNVCVQGFSDSCHNKANNCITSHDIEFCSMNGNIQDYANNVKDFEIGVVNRYKMLMKHNSFQVMERKGLYTPLPSSSHVCPRKHMMVSAC